MVTDFTGARGIERGAPGVVTTFYGFEPASTAKTAGPARVGSFD